MLDTYTHAWRENTGRVTLQEISFCFVGLGIYPPRMRMPRHPFFLFASMDIPRFRR